MEITNKVIYDVNMIINDIAEDYYQDTQYDDDGHAFDMRWTDCVDHAKDDFIADVKGYMDCAGYELTPNDVEQIEDYAWKYVNVNTINEAEAEG